MSHFIKIRSMLPVLALIILGVSACDNGTPTPEPTVYNPGCSVQNLIGHINQANSNPDPAVINLANCVYTLTEADNSAQVDGITVYNGLPVISSKITIRGNNAVIEVQEDPGEPFFGPFLVNQDGDLELYDMLISDGSRPVGGAVINNGGDFFASDVTFTNNTAFPADNGVPARGGAIFTIDGRVRVIDGSHFQENTAGETMAAGANLGGAIYSVNSTLLVSNSTFLWNNAAGDGGAIYAEKTAANENGGLITITDSQFNENSAYQYGGSVALVNEEEGVFITTSWFRGGEAGNFGGAVYAEGSEVTSSHVDYRFNTAEYGGAVYSKRLGEGLLSQFSDDNSEYIGNTASEIGGAIFSENSDLTVDEVTFNYNQANSCGAIRNGGNPALDVRAGDLETAQKINSSSLIKGSQFVFNDALLLDGGGACHVMGELAVRDSIFTYNSAVESGGGLLIQDAAQIQGSSFNNNSAANGGGVYIGHPLDLASGGAVDYYYVNYLDFYTSISGSVFSANDATRGGGGLFAHSYGTTLIEKSYFRNNIAAGSGGGLLRWDGKMFINNSTFSANTASRGGGLKAYGQVDSRMGIKHSTFAFNAATETSNGGNVYNTMWGGGALNVGYHTTVENSLIYQNSPMDCQLANGSNYSASATYDSDGTCGSLTEPNPQIGPLQNNGGGTKTHALLPGSPLIDILQDCASLTEDQRGVIRPQGVNCDPGAYELDPSNPPPPPPISLPGEGAEDPGTSISEEEDTPDYCSLFKELDISTVVLAIPPETMVMPLYFNMPGGVPGLSRAVPGGPDTWDFEAHVGWYVSYRCSLQGFEDRLYCMFNLTPEAPGQVLDLALYLNDCGDSIYTQPSLTIPLLVCSVDLSQEACEAAGGIYPDIDDPYCFCP